jgi:hypothetical protein
MTIKLILFSIKGSLLLPASILFSILSYRVSLRQIIFELTAPLIVSIYIIVVSLKSPCPFFININRTFGGYLIVGCWLFISCAFMRVRCLIAAKLESHGHENLLAYGGFTTLGQVIGGISVYLCVNLFGMFKDRPVCSNEICIS